MKLPLLSVLFIVMQLPFLLEARINLMIDDDVWDASKTDV